MSGGELYGGDMSGEMHKGSMLYSRTLQESGSLDSMLRTAPVQATASYCLLIMSPQETG